MSNVLTQDEIAAKMAALVPVMRNVDWHNPTPEQIEAHEEMHRLYWAASSMTAVVILRQANRETQYLRFVNCDSANYAINHLLKQMDVISAVRGTDYPA